MNSLSLLQKARLNYKPQVPNLLQDVALTDISQSFTETYFIAPEIFDLFPYTNHLKPLEIKRKDGRDHKALDSFKIGVVLSGGQAPGGHNVISGLYDAIKQLNPNGQLFGFLNGPSGIIKGNFIEITDELLKNYRNQGGFDLIGSGRTKIETEEQLLATDQTIRNMDLDGLVVVGGDDSNTNAAILAERFEKQKYKTCVVGVPKTIDGDLRSQDIEISFGFDTACKVYSEIIGNLLIDALSAKKYYFFVKLMGRSASHIALECALQTHPNLTLIGEEIASQNTSLNEIIKTITDLIERRAETGKNYGLILIPEGIIEFIPEFKGLIKELNALISKQKNEPSEIESRGDLLLFISNTLSDRSSRLFKTLPKDIQHQLLLSRDSHGNVQVAKIETERLLIEMVEEELAFRASKGTYKGSFSPQPMFCGYEGRSALPSNFDSNYCYALGLTAAIFIANSLTGYLCCLKGLNRSPANWIPFGIPLTSLMKLEDRQGNVKPVIRKALVDLKGQAFLEFSISRTSWQLNDDYISPGSIQYFGPSEISDSITNTLKCQEK